MTADLVDHDLLASPQAPGTFPFPVGLLLVPAGEGHDEVAATLADGRVPSDWPATLEGLRRAHAGDLAGARAAFEAAGDPVSAYDAWVLEPGDGPWQPVRDALPEAYRPLADVVAWTSGRLDRLPADDHAAAPDLLPLVLTTRSAAHLEDGDPARAHASLAAAREAALAAGLPVLAAAIGASLASHLLDHDESAVEDGVVRGLLREAHEVLRGTGLASTRAEVLLHLGGLLQEEAAAGRGDARTLLHEAARHYYEGLQLVTEQGDPVLWARLQLNLATAHLAVPMTTASDQLRVGVAAQSLRAARRVLAAETQPGAWSTATINLANALVYTPSTHQGDNLVEAVELYEEVLASGVRDDDPLGRARLLANLGNALAHLGVLDHARARLVEARFLFEEHLDHDGALTVRAVLDEVAKAELAASGVRTPGLAQDADLARQAEQLSRMPTVAVFTAGMGVQALGLDAVPPPKPTVTVLPRTEEP